MLSSESNCVFQFNQWLFIFILSLLCFIDSICLTFSFNNNQFSYYRLIVKIALFEHRNSAVLKNIELKCINSTEEKILMIEFSECGI